MVCSSKHCWSLADSGLIPVLSSSKPASLCPKGLTLQGPANSLCLLLLLQEDDEKLIEEIQKEAEEEQKRKNGGKCFPQPQPYATHTWDVEQRTQGHWGEGNSDSEGTTIQAVERSLKPWIQFWHLLMVRKSQGWI